MATFLRLCQDVARESGTVPNIGDPPSVIDQTGRLAQIVYWVHDAWNNIQTERRDWLWMRAEFSGRLDAKTLQLDRNGLAMPKALAYDLEDLGLETDEDRFSEWITHGPTGENLFTVYKLTAGIADEGLLQVLSWHDFRRLVIGGSITATGRPIYMAINDAKELVFYPTPDETYIVRGVYRQRPQTLAADADVPEMPQEFHDLIRYEALMLMGAFDEAVNQMGFWQMQHRRLKDALLLHQTPRVDVGGPLA